ncbi:MAG: NAD-dependent epimerase/dehydratase family protein, partial [Nitrospinales bacterium]
MATGTMRIGVTGASGFIGSHLLRALEQLPNVTVHSLKRKNKDTPPASDELKDFVREKDLIYHLGGVNRGTGEEIVKGNVEATFNLVQTLNDLGGKTRIVFASSSQVYKPGAEVTACDESYATEPSTLYGICKKTAEELIRVSGLDYSLLRLSNVYGPGCRPYYNSVVATFCERAVRRQSLSVNGDGEQGRDFIFIDDVVRALVLAGTTELKEKSDVFNISSGKITSLRKILETIKQFVPELEIVYHENADPGEVSPCYANDRFKERYNWNPETSLEAGIKLTLESFNKID